jgi:imidazolonepropionase-like amidohydrolase
MRWLAAMLGRNLYNSGYIMKLQAIALLAAVSLQSAVPSVIAIRNVRVVTAAGPAIPKGTVVIRDGIIESVGTDAAVPSDAWVVEGPQLTVYPGLIDGLSTWGMPAAAPTTPSAPGRGGGPPNPSTPPAQGAPPPARGPEDRPSNTSWVQAQDMLRPNDRSIVVARNAGFTTAVVFPTTGIFAGQGAAVNLHGEKAGGMVVAAPAGMYMSTTVRGTGFPNSIMGVFAYMRQIFLDADHYKADREAYAANPRGRRRPEYDRALEGVLMAPRILLPATRAVEIERMIRFAAEWKRQAVLYGGHEGYAAADRLKKAGVPVLVSLRWPDRDRDADPEMRESLRTLEMREKATGTPAALHKAGVKFAFYSGGAERPADLRRAARQAVDAGLPADEAVRALTLSVAEIYGIADRVGSIEKGKIANLLVTDGDLFGTSTRIRHVFVDGVKYDPSPDAPETAREESR